MTTFTEIENQFQYFFMRQRKEITFFSKNLHYKFLYLFNDSVYIAIFLKNIYLKKRLKLFSWRLRDVITNFLITNGFQNNFIYRNENKLIKILFL